MNKKQTENKKYQDEEPKKRQDQVEKDHNQKVDAETIVGFVQELEENETSVSKLSGEKSAIYKRAESVGIHKAAFKDAIRAHKMDDGTKASYMNARSQYDKILGNFNDKQKSFDLDDSLEGDEK